MSVQHPELIRQPAIRQPVDVASVDPRDADGTIAIALAAAGKHVRGVDEYTTRQLVRAATAAIRSGETRDGLKLGRLLDAAYVGSGHARDRHFTPQLTVLCDLAVRATAIAAGRLVRCEHVYVKWARTGRERNSLGTDRVRGVTAGLRFAGIAPAYDDRVLPAVEIPFTTGTRHDIASERADPPEIGRLTRELGHPLNSSVADHFKELLALQQRSRACLQGGPSDDVSLASRLGKHGFSDLVIATLMPCGPAYSRQREGAEVRAPGDDGELIRVLQVAGKRGVAQLHSRSPYPATTPESLRGEGYEQRDSPYSEYDIFFANDVEWGVTWHWHSQRRRLVRLQADHATVRADEWLVFGLERELHVALALARRHEQKWTGGCLTRYMHDAAPGLIEVSSYRSDVAVRDILRMANAACVQADRLGRARHAAC